MLCNASNEEAETGPCQVTLAPLLLTIGTYFYSDVFGERTTPLKHGDEG
jgi:hypothetical protein